MKDIIYKSNILNIKSELKTMNTDLTINTELINNELKIDLPAEKIGIIRQDKFYGPLRERVTGEKYFRQKIQVYNKEGKLIYSGFVQINDYTYIFKMVIVCNKSKKLFSISPKTFPCFNQRMTRL